MKSMNVKKLVALGVAAGLVAAPVAHAAMNTANLPTSIDWYTQATIIIGDAAKPEDVVWAGNIAAAIGNLAYKETEKTVSVTPEDAVVKISTPGEVIVGKTGYREDVDIVLGGVESLSKTDFTDTDINGLKYNAEEAYRIKSGDEWQDKTAYITEKVHIAANGFNFEPYQLENSKDVELRAAVGVDKLYYEVDVTGLPEDASALYVKDTNLADLTIPILGKDFIITKLETDSSGKIDSVELATYATEVQLKIGDEYDLGDGYKVKVDDIENADQVSDRRVLLTLIKPDGTTVSKVVQYGDSTDFDGALDYEISVKEIFVGITESYVTLGMKAEKISATGIATTPYIKEDFLDKKFDLEISGDTGSLTFKVIWKSDDDGTYASIDKGMTPGEYIQFPTSTLGVAFEGLTTEDMVPFKIDSGTVTTIDADGRVVTAKLTYRATSVAANSKRSVSNFYAGKTLYYEIDDTATAAIKYSLDSDALDQSATLYGDLATGAVTTIDMGNGVTYLVFVKQSATSGYDIYFTLFTAGAAAPAWDSHKVYKVDPAVKGTKGGYYGVAFSASGTVDDNSSSTLNLGDIQVLIKDSDNGSAANVSGVAVDIGNDGTTDATIGSGTTLVTADIDNDGTKDVAYWVSVSGIGTATANVTLYGPVTFESGKYAFKITTPVTGEAIYVPVDVDDTYKYKVTGLKLDEDDVVYDNGTKYYVNAKTDDTTVPDWWLTDFGGEIKATGTASVDIEIPTNVRKVKLFVGWIAPEEQGELELKVGDEIPGTSYKIVGVSAPDVTVKEYEMIQLPTQFVRLDKDFGYNPDAVPDKVILVGGYYVNKITEALADQFSELKEIDQPGEYIVDKYDYAGKEFIVVFGYTAADTGTAAQEFINWLRDHVEH